VSLLNTMLCALCLCICPCLRQHLVVCLLVYLLQPFNFPSVAAKSASSPPRF
jgi:hypothetical protein